MIMVAPNGARRGRADHPQLPVTLPEILTTAEACYAAGADALHLHVRDETAGHSLDGRAYKEALAELAVRLPDMAVQITTESAGIFDVEDQFSCLQTVRPSWASISVREMAREPELAEKTYQFCDEADIEIQHILYDADDVAMLYDWQDKGVIHPEQDSVIFVLGRYTANQQSRPDDLTPFLDAMPNPGKWMICAFGADEHACLVDAASRGGDVRVGFENSLVASDGTPHADNAASVRSLRDLLEINDEE
jgi:uncharacterized protein (DUF849 family)